MSTRRRGPVPSGIAVRGFRQTSQDVYPYDIRCAQALQAPAFAVRESSGGIDAHQLAREHAAWALERLARAAREHPSADPAARRP